MKSLIYTVVIGGLSYGTYKAFIVPEKTRFFDLLVTMASIALGTIVTIYYQIKGAKNRNS